jgi:hypothetical protein
MQITCIICSWSGDYKVKMEMSLGRMFLQLQRKYSRYCIRFCHRFILHASNFGYSLITDAYSLCPNKNVVLAFGRRPTKNVVLSMGPTLSRLQTYWSIARAHLSSTRLLGAASIPACSSPARTPLEPRMRICLE